MPSAQGVLSECMNHPAPHGLPRVVADGPLPPAIVDLLAGRVELLPWSLAEEGSRPGAAAIFTYGHPRVDGRMLDRLPCVKVISNYGVGVDHIDLAAAAARGIPVGNTPGILDGATADMAFALLLAAARRLVEGDRYARVGDLHPLRSRLHARPRGPRQHAGDHRPGPYRPADCPSRRRVRHERALPQPSATRRSRARAGRALCRARRAAGRRRLRRAQRAALARNPRASRRGGADEDEADGHAGQRLPRAGRRYGGAHAGAARNGGFTPPRWT